MSACKGCGEPIKWIRSNRGKLIPCDPEPEVMYLKPMPPGERITLILEDGSTVSGYRADRYESGTLKTEGYLSHFGTCPHAEQFRKKARGE